MSPTQFRNLALSFPEAQEGSHMGHPDFRVCGKIFATLGPEGEWGMVKLSPEQQAEYIKEEPDTFTPVKGAWGRQGCTHVHFEGTTDPIVRRALTLAWRRAAPKRLLREFPES